MSILREPTLILFEVLSEERQLKQVQGSIGLNRKIWREKKSYLFPARDRVDECIYYMDDGSCDDYRAGVASYHEMQGFYLVLIF